MKSSDHDRTATVRYEVVDHVAIVTLNRPERLNAFTDAMEQELVDAFGLADADEDVRVVLLTGSGRAFCAGMDLGEADPADTFTAWRRSPTAPPGTQFDVEGDDLPVRRDGGGRVALRAFASLKPIIAAVNGPAIGVGATMTLPADLRLCSDTARFAFPFVRRALVPESCSSWFLPRVVPVQQAAEWMLTGRTFDAAEALRGGLVRSVHPGEALLGAALEIAGEIAGASAVSVAATRRMMWAMLTQSHPMRAHEVETLALNERGVSGDAQEGVSAFLSKRDPRFADRVSTDLPSVARHLGVDDYTPPGAPR